MKSMVEEVVMAEVAAMVGEAGVEAVAATAGLLLFISTLELHSAWPVLLKECLGLTAKPRVHGC